MKPSVRLLVEQHDPSLVTALRSLAKEPLSRLQMAKRLGVAHCTLQSMIERNGIAIEPLARRLLRARMARNARVSA